MAREDDRSRALMQLSGIGSTTASALVSTIGNARDFKNGRQLAAWLGLVPGQYSSGGKTRLGGITKAGDAYLRTLLVLGAKAVLAAAKNKDDRLSRWAMALEVRRGYWKAVRPKEWLFEAISPVSRSTGAPLNLPARKLAGSRATVRRLRLILSGTPLLFIYWKQARTSVRSSGCSDTAACRPPRVISDSLPARYVLPPARSIYSRAPFRLSRSL